MVHTVTIMLFIFKQKTPYEMAISDWSSDVCSSGLVAAGDAVVGVGQHPGRRVELGGQRLERRPADPVLFSGPAGRRQEAVAGSAQRNTPGRYHADPPGDVGEGDVLLRRVKDAQRRHETGGVGSPGHRSEEQTSEL